MAANGEKRFWTKNEDDILRDAVNRFGTGNWRKISKATGLARNRNSCRFRYLNYLDQGVNKEDYTEAEDDIIRQQQAKFGNRWTKIAEALPGRTDNSIKNRWHRLVKTRVCDANSNPITPSDFNFSTTLHNMPGQSMMGYHDHNRFMVPIMNFSEFSLDRPFELHKFPHEFYYSLNPYDYANPRNHDLSINVDNVSTSNPSNELVMSELSSFQMQNINNEFESSMHQYDHFVNVANASTSNLTSEPVMSKLPTYQRQNVIQMQNANKEIESSMHQIIHSVNVADVSTSNLSSKPVMSELPSFQMQNINQVDHFVSNNHAQQCSSSVQNSGLLNEEIMYNGSLNTISKLTVSNPVLDSENNIIHEDADLFDNIDISFLDSYEDYVSVEDLLNCSHADTDVEMPDSENNIASRDSDAVPSLDEGCDDYFNIDPSNDYFSIEDLNNCSHANTDVEIPDSENNIVCGDADAVPSLDGYDDYFNIEDFLDFSHIGNEGRLSEAELH